MDTLTRALAWCWAHQVQIMATVSIVATGLRTIPAERWAAVERDWPRAANLARLLRAVGIDGVKAARAIAAVWTGKPWPMAVAPSSATLESTSGQGSQR